MKVYSVLGKVPTLTRKKTHPKLIASRKNGAVKVFHPAAIRSLNKLLEN